MGIDALFLLEDVIYILDIIAIYIVYFLMMDQWEGSWRAIKVIFIFCLAIMIVVALGMTYLTIVERGVVALVIPSLIATTIIGGFILVIRRI